MPEWKEDTLEGIRIRLDKSSEKCTDEKYGLYSINAENMETLSFCPKCDGITKKKDKTKRVILDFRLSPSDGTAHFYSITLTSQRYFCRSCKETFTAGMLPRDLTHTRKFDGYITERLLHDHVSYNKLAESLPITRQAISKCVHCFMKETNNHFSPYKDAFCLYLHGFVYQKEKCYYLAKGSVMGDTTLVAFFGYGDPLEEMEEYFRFHFVKREKPAYLYYLVTNEPIYIRDSFQKYLGDIRILPSIPVIDAWMDSFQCDGDHVFYFPLKDKIDDLKNRLHDRFYATKIQEWWNDIPENSSYKKTLKPLWEKLWKHTEIPMGYQVFQPEFLQYKEDIRHFDSRKTPFEKMCMYLMYKEYGDDMFLEPIPETLLCDEDTGISYSPLPMNDLEKAVAQAKKVLALYGESSTDTPETEANGLDWLPDLGENPFA